MQSQGIRSVVGFVAGVLVFFAIAWGLKAGIALSGEASPQLSQGLLKGVVILVAPVGWKLLGRPMAEMGWVKAVRCKSQVAWFLLAAFSMMLATVAMLFLGVRHPLVSKF